MTNEEKASEIAGLYYEDNCESECYTSAMEMAEYKERQFIRLLTSLPKNEIIDNLIEAITIGEILNDY